MRMLYKRDIIYYLEVEICNFPGSTGALKCPSDPQFIDRPTENLLFATLLFQIFKFLPLAEIRSQRSCKINFDLHITSYKKKVFLQTNDFSNISSNNRYLAWL